MTTLLLLFILTLSCFESAIIPISSSCSSSGTCTQLINEAITSCKSEPYCTISLDSGVYNLKGSAFSSLITISDASNLAIIGQGDSTLLLADNIHTFFVISGGTNISLSSFSVDMERLPFTYGLVTSSEKVPNSTLYSSTIIFNVTDYPIDLSRYDWLGTVQAIMGYDPILRHPSLDNLDIYALSPTYYANYPTNKPGTMIIQVAPKLPLGENVIIRHQVYSFNFANAEKVVDISYSNISLYATGGMGFYTHQCSGVSLNGVRIVRINNRPMSITADGAHIQDSQGGSVLIRNCTFDGQGDDGINVPTTFQEIVSINLQTMQFQLGGRNAPLEPPLFTTGNTVYFYNRSSMAILGSEIVTAILSNNTVQIGGVSFPEGIGLYSLVLSPQNFADYTEIVDCTFSNNRARGALVKTSNAYIARNTFSGMSMSAIKTETDGCYWFEGRPVINWTATNNTFSSCNYWIQETNGNGDISIDSYVPIFNNGIPTTQCNHFIGHESAVQENLTITNNVFNSLYNQTPITIWSTNGLNASSNKVYIASGSEINYAIIGQGVSNSIAINNLCNGEPCKTSGV
jgi:hypothetical protein